MNANERQYPLPGFAFIRLHSRFLYSRLVHLLDDLKGQDDIADLAGLTVPDQFHLALVLEEQETKLVRQGLVRLQKTDDLLLFLFSQSWHGNTLLLGVLPGPRPRGAL